MFPSRFSYSLSHLFNQPVSLESRVVGNFALLQLLLLHNLLDRVVVLLLVDFLAGAAALAAGAGSLV